MAPRSQDQYGVGKDMILAIDAGNTYIVFGTLDREQICNSWRISTERFKTADEYSVLMDGLLRRTGTPADSLEGCILSCVVPSLKKTLADAAEIITGKSCLIVGPGLKNGLRIRIDDPAQLGSDQVAAAVAATEEYSLPMMIFDMSTATTVSVIDAKGAYLGGMIMPGVQLGMEALALKTSQLPQISLSEKPSRLIGTNTIACMESGCIYGSASAIDGIIDRVREELGTALCVVATGDSAEWIIPFCRHDIQYDKDLLLKGLRSIYYRNAKTRVRPKTRNVP